MDVVVTDKKGNAIRGLKQEDLTVTEDGVPQTIVSFEAVRAARPALRGAPAAAPGLGQHHARGAPGPDVRRSSSTT